ncbi:MAG: hypothetical protein LC122_11955 [Chitinophagales bacterium]|nr:hypothetical protein [Chitinophagales bacterium]
MFTAPLNDKEYLKAIEKLKNLGLVEEKIIDGKIYFPLTIEGEMYFKNKIFFSKIEVGEC